MDSRLTRTPICKMCGQAFDGDEGLRDHLREQHAGDGGAGQQGPPGKPGSVRRPQGPEQGERSIG